MTVISFVRKQLSEEVECAVLGDRTQVKSTCVGEILAAEEAAFYDFDAKYNNAESKTVVDPRDARRI